MDQSLGSKSKEASTEASENKVGHKPYMDQTWWLFLPFYIFIALAIINLIVLVFSGANAGAFIAYVIFAILWGLLLWWVCDIGELGWAWFLLLLPLILAVLTSIVAAGVTGGIVAAEGVKGMVDMKAAKA